MLHHTPSPFALKTRGFPDNVFNNRTDHTGVLGTHSKQHFKAHDRLCEQSDADIKNEQMLQVSTVQQWL